MIYILPTDASSLQFYFYLENLFINDSRSLSMNEGHGSKSTQDQGKL